MKIKIISEDNLVESKVVSTGDIGEAIEGCLVIVEGEVAGIKDDVFFLNDGSGEIKIYIKPQTGIIKPEIEKDDWMVITGQVSQTSAGYRILPRFQGDIRLSRVTGVAQAADISNSQENTEDDKKEKAEDIFKALNAAYQQKDVKKVSEILEQLLTGESFSITSDTVFDRKILKRKIGISREKIKTIKIELESIKLDETFVLVNKIDDLEEYFILKKRELQEEKENILEQMRKYSHTA